MHISINIQFTHTKQNSKQDYHTQIHSFRHIYDNSDT